MELEILKAKFISEGHNRFISLIELEDKIIECYVPSSSKLSTYLKLEGKEVLVSKNLKSRRTSYSLFAVSYYNKYIILNLNLVNKLLLNYLKETRSFKNYFLEKNFLDYKTDILFETLEEEYLIIEAKGIIGTNKKCNFPIKHSDRAINQLEALNKLLDKGIKVEYYLVCLSPIIQEIHIDTNDTLFYKALNQCRKNGMLIKAISINYCALDNDFSFKTVKINM